MEDIWQGAGIKFLLCYWSAWLLPTRFFFFFLNQEYTCVHVQTHTPIHPPTPRHSPSPLRVFSTIISLKVLQWSHPKDPKYFSLDWLSLEFIWSMKISQTLHVSQAPWQTSRMQNELGCVLTNRISVGWGGKGFTLTEGLCRMLCSSSGHTGPLRVTTTSEPAFLK